MKYPSIEIKVDEPNRVVFGFVENTQIKALAKCSKEDTFDASFGRRLVAAKLRKTCAKLKLQHLKQMRKEFLKQIDADTRDTETAIQKQTTRIHNIKIEKYPENQ